MKISRAIGAMLLLSVVSACGGGGGGKSGGAASLANPSTPPVTPPVTPPLTPPETPPVTPPATPEVHLTVSTSPISKRVSFGDEGATEVAGEWSATNLGESRVYLQVADDGGTFAAPAVQPSNAGKFAYQLPLSDTVVPGTRTGTLTVRSCEDVLCARPYANTTRTLAYTVVITASPEWESTQGNAAHNGYVPITLNPAKFAKAWEWKRPQSSAGTTGPINSVATWERSVVVSEDSSAGGPSVYSLNERDGSVRWRHQFALGGSIPPPLTAPAVSQGRVYIATTAQQDTYLWSLDANHGTVLTQSPFKMQWGALLAPTVKDGQAYVNAGTFGMVVYAFNALSGQPLWQGGGGTAGLNTPSIDDEGRVYIHGYVSLNVLDSKTGDVLAVIASETAGPATQEDYHAVAMLGLPDSITAPYDTYIGGGASSSDSRFPRNLKNYSLADKAVRWTSAKKYVGYAAVANGVVYAASNSPRSFDALDEKTGNVLWSWLPPGNEGFYRNVVVTDNLAFVSTNRALYAIDLATQKPVWESPTPGTVSISASRMIYVTTGTGQSDGRLIAFRTNATTTATVASVVQAALAQ